MDSNKVIETADKVGDKIWDFFLGKASVFWMFVAYIAGTIIAKAVPTYSWVGIAVICFVAVFGVWAHYFRKPEATETTE